MFTGLISTTGSVLKIERGNASCRIGIASAVPLSLNIGDSVAVSGVCLTATEVDGDGKGSVFFADLAAETIARTSLSRLAPHAIVNLELPTPAGAPLGGHVVQGHVDATGTLLSLTPSSGITAGPDADWTLRVQVPRSLGPYLVEKGSIAIEGISLTIARRLGELSQGIAIEVAVIPHTYAHTNLPTLNVGDPVNIEADILFKYLEQQNQCAKPFELTVEYLLANGY